MLISLSCFHAQSDSINRFIVVTPYSLGYEWSEALNSNWNNRKEVGLSIPWASYLNGKKTDLGWTEYFTGLGLFNRNSIEKRKKAKKIGKYNSQSVGFLGQLFYGDFFENTGYYHPIRVRFLGASYEGSLQVAKEFENARFHIGLGVRGFHYYYSSDYFESLWFPWPNVGASFRIGKRTGY